MIPWYRLAKNARCGISAVVTCWPVLGGGVGEPPSADSSFPADRRRECLNPFSKVSGQPLQQSDLVGDKLRGPILLALCDTDNRGAGSWAGAVVGTSLSGNKSESRLTA